MSIEEDRRNWLDVTLTGHVSERLTTTSLTPEQRSEALVAIVNLDLVEKVMEELRYAFRQGYDAHKAVATDLEKTGDAEYDRQVRTAVRVCQLPTWEELKALRGL